MNAARRVNLRDIAEASGVSIQTVSRVVRGLDVVAEPTRSRVMEAVERLGYRPNLAARSLSAHRTGQVHVIVAMPLYHGHAMTFVSIC
jgi:DNA-binding LacI/PurR family transcriptional regulator